jgi:hypothetical protein
MRRLIKFIAAIGLLSVSLILPVSTSGQTPKPYPNDGDLSYDGTAYADSFFSWAAIGGFRDASNNGWEMDISVGETYYDACTSWTNLPDPYDDCPTAGKTDPAGRINFGIGSYCVGCIAAGPYYTGKWWFSGGSGASTYPNVTWQEVARQLCPQKSIGCYFGVQGSSLMETYWRYGYPDYKEWFYAT